jgi:hypothetical protein
MLLYSNFLDFASALEGRSVVGSAAAVAAVVVAIDAVAVESREEVIEEVGEENLWTLELADSAWPATAQQVMAVSPIDWPFGGAVDSEIEATQPGHSVENWIVLAAAAAAVVVAADVVAVVAITAVGIFAGSDSLEAASDWSVED